MEVRSSHMKNKQLCSKHPNDSISINLGAHILGAKSLRQVNQLCYRKCIANW